MGEPIRSCIVCRKRSQKVDLLRLVYRADKLQVDQEQVEQSRGCYVHREVACVAGLKKSGLINRALRLGPGAPGVVEVIELIDKINLDLLPRDNHSGRSGRRTKRMRL